MTLQNPKKAIHLTVELDSFLNEHTSFQFEFVSYLGFECRDSVDQTDKGNYLEIRLLRNNHISYICTHVRED